MPPFALAKDGIFAIIDKLYYNNVRVKLGVL